MSDTTAKPVDGRQLHELLRAVRHAVVSLHQTLKLKTGFDLAAFARNIDAKLLIKLDPDYPLMIAITGGGSTGKSSLFNALVNDHISAVKARAGFSRRVLAAIHPSVRDRPGFLPSLFEAFGCIPEPLNDSAELTTPGTPKYVVCDSVPRNLVLLDTPDFDTGDREGFANRQTAKPILEACDVLLYLFVNSNHNNRDNTAFLREMLTGVGCRKSILIYRCTRVLSEGEVREHSEIVARNIYGDQRAAWCLGVYRINEDDEVAAGHAFMRVDTLPGALPLLDVLAKLDCAQTRTEIIRSALESVLKDARSTHAAATLERLGLDLYRDAVRIATSHATKDALREFPKEDLMKLFLKTWEATQSPGLKLVRSAGRKIALPITFIAKTYVQVRHFFRKPEAHRNDKADPSDVFRKNLAEAANHLRNQLLGQELAVITTARDPVGARMKAAIKSMRAHPGARLTGPPCFEELENGGVNLRVARPASLSVPDAREPGDWNARLGRLRDEASQFQGVSDEFTSQLGQLVHTFRAEMSVWDKLRETFTASLSSLAAIVAVTYVVTTGDPVGGGTLYAKLVALFGLSDLWALLVIPAATGLNHIHRQQMQHLLNPVFGKWLDEKASKLRELLEREIAAPMLASADRALADSEAPCRNLDQALSDLQKGGLP